MFTSANQRLITVQKRKPGKIGLEHGKMSGSDLSRKQTSSANAFAFTHKNVDRPRPIVMHCYDSIVKNSIPTSGSDKSQKHTWSECTHPQPTNQHTLCDRTVTA